MSGAELIAAERERQVAEEGWTPEHDDEHARGELARAAACYAMPADAVHLPYYRIFARAIDDPDYSANPLTPKPGQISWPWGSEHYKRTPDDRIRELTKAGALIAAEIDRLQRARE